MGLALLAPLLFAAPAVAQPPEVHEDVEEGVVFLGPGHEAAVLALFAPKRLGDEVAAGLTLHGVAIEPRAVLVTLRAPDGREATLRLTEPAPGEGPPDGGSFAVEEDGAPEADAVEARAALRALVASNDDGTFWGRAEPPRRDRPLPPVAEEPPPDLMRQAELWRERLWVPLDGLLVVLLVYLLGLVLAARLLADEPRWMIGALAATVLGGAALRVALAPATFLGAWPWARLYPHIRQVAEGSWLRALAGEVGHGFFLTDVAMTTNLAYAVAMPLVLFAHATYLLRDARAGLAASAALAVLPQHIRFSRCEDGFVASLVLTSLAFALIHGWLRDRRAVVRWLLLLALPFVLYPGYRLRPLNILFVVVYAGAVALLHGETAPRWRRGVALAIVLAVGGHAAFELVQSNAEIIANVTTRVEWPIRMIVVLISPIHLVLTDPTRTPPGLIVAAGVGAWITWREDRRLAVFLVGWLVLFAWAHATVMQVTMQPRYHLHLVVPFLLLGARALPWLKERWATHRRPIVAGLALTAAAPLVHLWFIRDLDYVEVQELELVRGARDALPEGCVVLEAAGEDAASLRFARIGARVGGDEGARYRAIGVLPDGATTDGRSVDAIVAEAPACLALYEGLPCITARGPGEPTEAGACVALRRRLDEEPLELEPVASADAPARFYDEENLGEEPYDAARVPLRLFRIRTDPR